MSKFSLARQESLPQLLLLVAFILSLSNRRTWEEEASDSWLAIWRPRENLSRTVAKIRCRTIPETNPYNNSRSAGPSLSCDERVMSLGHLVDWTCPLRKLFFRFHYTRRIGCRASAEFANGRQVSSRHCVCALLLEYECFDRLVGSRCSLAMPKSKREREPGSSGADFAFVRLVCVYKRFFFLFIRSRLKVGF